MRGKQGGSFNRSLFLIFGLLAVSCNQQQAVREQASPAKDEPVTSSAGERVASPPAGPSSSPESAESSGVHRDHNPRHGGTFFMALDGLHHLEGILVPPATFRVYLYDVHTRPLASQELSKAEGKVVWGDSSDAPQIPLHPSPDGQCLEAVLGEPARFPVTLTLRLRFPGSPSEARPELFTFPFSHYSGQYAERPDHH